MDLILLYGLPASGKLTTAQALVDCLGDTFKIFHNQMTVDIISPIIPFPHPKGFELSEKWRRDMIMACAEIDINLITTLVYASEDQEKNREEVDAEYIRFLMKTVEQSGGQIMFVHLQCDLETIFQRLPNEDRRRYRKLTNPEGLKQSMRRWELTKPISFVDSLTIDTITSSPAETASKIIEHYDLSTQH